MPWHSRLACCGSPCFQLFRESVVSRTRGRSSSRFPDARPSINIWLSSRSFPLSFSPVSQHLGISAHRSRSPHPVPIIRFPAFKKTVSHHAQHVSHVCLSYHKPPRTHPHVLLLPGGARRSHQGLTSTPAYLTAPTFPLPKHFLPLPPFLVSTHTLPASIPPVKSHAAS